MKRLEQGTFGIFPAQLVRGKNPIYQTIVAWLWVHSNNEGQCYPSLNTIAEETGVHRTTVLRYLEEIEKDGLISRQKKLVEGSQEYDNTKYTVYKDPRVQSNSSAKVDAENDYLGAESNNVGADDDGGVGAQSDLNYTSKELNRGAPPYNPPRGRRRPKKVFKIFAKESEPYRLAQLLFELMRHNSPDCLPKWQDPQIQEAGLQAWAEVFDLVLRVDGRPPGDVEVLLNWCQNDKFWKANILSAAKFREQYDQLKIKAKTNFSQTIIYKFTTV